MPQNNPAINNNFEKALEKSLTPKFSKLDEEKIFSLYKIVCPEIIEILRFPQKALFRRGGIQRAFSKCNAKALLERFQCLEKFADKHACYGPRFYFEENGIESEHFLGLAELRKYYEVESNKDLASKIETELNACEGKKIFSIVFIFDSLNHLIDVAPKKPATIYDAPDETIIDNQKYQQIENQLADKGYKTFDAIGSNFSDLLNDFIKLEKPSIEDIVHFIFELHTLHPFLDGNSRLCSILLKSLLYHHGYALELDINFSENFVYETTSALIEKIKMELKDLKNETMLSASFFKLSTDGSASASNDEKVFPIQNINPTSGN